MEYDFAVCLSCDAFQNDTVNNVKQRFLSCVMMFYKVGEEDRCYLMIF